MIENSSSNNNEKDKNKVEYISTDRKLIETEPPREKDPLKVEPPKRPKKKFERNLLFKLKHVSIITLIFHISETPELLIMLVGIICTIFSGISTPLLALVFGGSISKLSKAADADNMSKELYDVTIIEIEKDIKKMCVKILCLGAAMFVANFLMQWAWVYSSLRQMDNFKSKYFATILSQEQTFFDHNNPYEFATKVQAQCEKIEGGIGDKFGQIILTIVNIIGGYTVGFIENWKLTLILLTVLPIFIISSILFKNCVVNNIIKANINYEKTGGLVEELLYNIKTVTSFVNFDYEMKRYGDLILIANSYEHSKNFWFGISVMLVTFAHYVGLGNVLIYGRKLIADGEVEPGTVLAVMMSVVPALFSTGRVAPNIQNVYEASVGASDYFTLKERTKKVEEGGDKLDDIKGTITFENVSFKYPGTEKYILKDVSFEIPAGKKVAIVGESGSGKSTIINLLERFYDFTEGRILIDGHDIKSLDLKFLRDSLGYVQQEPVLFNRSIRENLVFGREKLIRDKNPGVDNIDEILEKSCEDAHAMKFINKFNDKFSNVVGIKGGKLSGGEKQRIAIARALLLQPKILLLDEATSALDNESEKIVQKALDNIGQKNITMVTIAHRLSTVRNSDIIFVLDGGKIREKGTHQELLDKGGYYANMVNIQMKQESNPELMKKISMEILKKRLSSRGINPDEINKIKIPDDKKTKKETKKKISPFRLWKYISDKKCDLIFATVCTFLYGLIHPTVGFLTGLTINCFSSHNLTKILDRGLKYSLIFYALSIFGGLTSLVRIWKIQELGTHLASAMRRVVLEKYLSFHVGYFDEEKHSPGSILTKLSIDTTQIHLVLLSLSQAVLTTVGMIILGLVLSFVFDWKVTLIMLCFIPFMVLSQVLTTMYQRGGKYGYKQLQIESGNILSECVVNTLTVFAFNFREYAVKMYSEISKREVASYFRDSVLQGLLIGFCNFCGFACYAAIFFASIKFMKKRTLTFENMNYSVNILMTMTTGISTALANLGDYAKAKLSFLSLFSIIDTKSLIDASEKANKDKRSIPDDFNGKIELRNVTFSYPTKPNIFVLKNVSLTIEPGKKAALVGNSGCGKSTIIQLVERFYDVEDGKGEVLIDGVNIKEYNLFELRKRIGLVSQEPILFKRSPKDNIRYGKLDAGDEEIFNSAKKANIEKYLMKPQIQEKYELVSGGEKQRLAMARIFLKDPKILLLDEPTSALDKQNEAEIQKRLSELMYGRTSVTVAHRLSTIVNSDIIFAMKDGEIVEKGSHEELMKKRGHYYGLFMNSE